MIRVVLNPRLFSLLLAACFFWQVSIVVPSHASHISQGEHSSQSKKPGIPDEHSCDLCLTLHALDSASAVKPPQLGLAETAFAVVAAYSSYIYSTPILFSFARGPPASLTA